MKKVIAVTISLAALVLAAEWQSLNGPPAGRADDMSMGYDPTVPAYVIYAADQTHKLYKSTDEGEYWDSIQPLDVINPVCVITAPIDAQIVYIGKCGMPPLWIPVWKSTNGGQTWEPKSTGITNTQPRCFAMDPVHPDLVYAGFDITGGSECLYKTANGGASWSGCRMSHSVRDIYINPNDPTNLYIATDNSVYQSTNSGGSWERLPPPANSADVYSVTLNSAGEIFIGVVEWDGLDASGTIYKRNGVPWELVYSQDPVYLKWPIPTRILVDNSTDRYVFATFRLFGVHMSANYGNADSWAPINNGVIDKNLLSLVQRPEQGHLFAGGELVGLYKSTNTGENWVEKTKGMRLGDVRSLSAHNDRIYCVTHRPPDGPVTDGATWSRDAGVSWNWLDVCYELWPYYGGNCVKIASSHPDYLYRSWMSDIGGILRSTNAGAAWTSVLESGGYVITDLAVGSTDHQVVRAASSGWGLPSPPRAWRTTDGGGSWFWYQLPVNGSLNAVANDPLDIAVVYIGGWWQTGPGEADRGPYLKKSTDGGISWNEAVGGMMGSVKEIAIDPINSQNLFAVSDSGPFRSTDAGQLWNRKKSSLTDYYGTDIIIDPEEPAIIYTLEQHDATSTTNIFHGSVDGAAEWFEFTLPPGQNPPGYLGDITIDNTRTDCVYAGTPHGAYAFYPQFINKHLTSSSPEATGINNAKHMLCGMSDIWLTYESGGVIYAVHSTDAGVTWSRKMEIGYGYNPVIASNPGYDPPLPCIVWWAQGTRDTLYFSRHVMEYTWTAPYPVVTTNNNYSPPSFIVGTDDIGRIVYVERAFDDRIYYTQFNINNPNPVTDPVYFTGINPSIGYMPSNANNPEIHLAWEQNGNIRYRSRTQGGIWSSQETVFSGGCTHPALEISGAAVYFVSARAGTIRYRYTVYTQNGNHSWAPRPYDFPTSYPLDYPVLTGGYAMSCVVDFGSSNKEIYFYYNPGLSWIGPLNISNTSQRSYYPHIVHRQTIVGTVVHFIWTENDNPAYDIKFANHNIGGYDSGEDLAFYAAIAGDTLASPFNLKRTGFLHFGAESYKHVDYDNQYLEYQFLSLDPDKDYALTAYVYQKGYSNLPLSLKIDNILIKSISLPPETLITFKTMVPYNFYTDSMIDIKIIGNKAVSSVFVLHQYEKEQDEGGGPQGMITTPATNAKSSFNIYPSLMTSNLEIECVLAHTSEITIELFDVTGRVVNTLMSSNALPSGKYRHVFSLPKLPQGIYFVRMRTDDCSIVEKAVFVK